MDEIWGRIEAWFAEHLPDAPLALRPGASEEAILAAEARLGLRFPDAFRESLRVHDGQDDASPVCWLPGATRLASLASITACWEHDRAHWDAEDPEGRHDWLDRSRRVRQVHFHPRQVPIAGGPDWAYDRLALDLVPGPEGHSGQLIQRDDIDLVFIATDFATFLGRFADGLERGTIVIGDREEEQVSMGFRSPRGKKWVRPSQYFAR
ncbi:MAG: SMI1/KNR4 family protein [Sandaracinaceae bacterium]|nr:SMI1/KNR4 family protein [Sandaracinaceae bacterium]